MTGSPRAAGTKFLQHLRRLRQQVHTDTVGNALSSTQIVLFICGSHSPDLLPPVFSDTSTPVASSVSAVSCSSVCRLVRIESVWVWTQLIAGHTFSSCRADIWLCMASSKYTVCTLLYGQWKEWNISITLWITISVPLQFVHQFSIFRTTLLQYFSYIIFA